MHETRPHHEIAHLACIELCSPDPAGSEWFFTQLLGMYVTERRGQSVYLRGYEDPYKWSLKITEGPTPRMVHASLRTSSADALHRRVRAVAAAGLGDGWIDGDFGHGPAYRFHTPDGHELRLLWEAEQYLAPPDLRSKILTRPSKKPLHGVPVRRIDHLNLMAADVSAVRRTCEDLLGMRTRERLVDGDAEVGTWMSSNNLGHEVAVMRDARGALGRFHHVAFYYGVAQHNADAAEMFREQGVPIEAGPDRHGISQGAFLYVFEPGGNRVELFGDPGVLVLEPDFRTRTWTMDEIDVGMAIGGAQLPWETYFTYGTPPVEAPHDGTTGAATSDPAPVPD